jgi:hypothetical protein
MLVVRVFLAGRPADQTSPRPPSTDNIAKIVERSIDHFEPIGSQWTKWIRVSSGIELIGSLK